MDKRGVSIANHWVVLLLLLLAAPSFYAQKTIVSGKVIDAETKEALPFVNVVFQDSKVGTSTDIDGNYRIETYYPTDSLQASFLGYNSLAKSVKKDVEQKVNFALSPGGVDIEEVVIEYE